VGGSPGCGLGVSGQECQRIAQRQLAALAQCAQSGGPVFHVSLQRGVRPQVHLQGTPQLLVESMCAELNKIHCQVLCPLPSSSLNLQCTITHTACFLLLTMEQLEHTSMRESGSLIGHLAVKNTAVWMAPGQHLECKLDGEGHEHDSCALRVLHAPAAAAGGTPRCCAGATWALAALTAGMHMSALYIFSWLSVPFTCPDTDNTRSVASQRSQQCRAGASTALTVLFADTQTGQLPGNLAI
jgi:hypothetical protein